MMKTSLCCRFNVLLTSIFLLVFLFKVGVSAAPADTADGHGPADITDISALAAFDKGGPAINFEHFPSRLHAFLWRNWPLVSAKHLAEILGTSPDKVHQVAATMGLPPQGEISPIWKSSQGYITLLRRNWHLLPYSQLLLLLDQTAEQLAESLQEDDFLFIKLGSVKPQCAPLVYHEPTEAENNHAKNIAEWIQQELGDDWTVQEEKRFEFLNTFFPDKGESFGSHSNRDSETPLPTQPPVDDSPFEIRFLFSYFATFGDPLLDPDVKSYPDELLRRLSEHGVNGVWLHTVLRTLAPGGDLFEDSGTEYEIRLRSLNTLVRRAEHYGIKVYLYMNEPRTMPQSFFQGPKAALAGVPCGANSALCTSTPEVKKWIADSLTHVFTNVPGLGGIFTITASENPTNCTSHYRKHECPRCKDRSVGDIIGELNSVMADAVHKVDPAAKVLAWDWGWADDCVPEIISKLPESVWLMSVSEWSLPIERGGIKSNVGEYSISSVGPGPRAKKHWALARQRGLKTVAKVQFNVTWELAAVPYVPVADLVAQHASNLCGSGVNGLMLSWSLGGWPSPNLEIAKAFQALPDGKIPEDEAEQVRLQNAVLQRIAEQYYGDGAALARQAWTIFSTGFREYPYNIGLCYSGPQHWGPANLVYANPTGYSATMVGIPYDAVKTWCAVYPPEVAAGQFRKVAEHFQRGLVPLRRAVELSPVERKEQTESEFRFAAAAGLHCASSANMIEFYTLRDRRLAATDTEQRDQILAEMKRILTDQIRVAGEMYRLVKSDSRIGYESSNHYWYVPIDIAEAIVSAKHFLRFTGSSVE